MPVPILLRNVLIGATLLLSSGLAAAQSSVEYNNRGIEAYNQGQFRASIQYFEQAHEGAADSPTVRRNLCNAHQALANEIALSGNIQQAIKHLEIAVGVEPDNPSPLVQLGSYYLRMEMVSDAIFRLEEAIELKPGELDAHELLGEAYYRDNDLASARAQWDYVIEMDPKRDALRQRYEKAFREESVEFDFNKGGSRHFKITYPKSVPLALRSKILTILERAYMDVGRRLGSAYPPPPVQVVLYDAEQFSEATQLADHVGAVYDGKIRAPLTDSKGEWLPEDELKRRLSHEYVHVVVRYIGGPNVPWWLNEGLAESLSRSLEAADTQLLQQGYADNSVPTLAQLEGSQLERLDAKTLRLAYSKSLATVNLLLTKYGQKRLNQVMADIASGMPAEQAIKRIYRRGYAALEEEVASGYH